MSNEEYCETCGNDYYTCEKQNADECNEVAEYKTQELDNELSEAAKWGVVVNVNDYVKNHGTPENDEYGTWWLLNIATREEFSKMGTVTAVLNQLVEDRAAGEYVLLP